MAEKLQLPDVETASKVRDIPTGKILATTIPRNDFDWKDVIVIDDIGDGFGTFIGLAKTIKEKNAKNLYLIVTHSIQEQGLKNALLSYEKIFTTNSIKQWDMEKVEVFNVF